MLEVRTVKQRRFMQFSYTPNDAPENSVKGAKWPAGKRGPMAACNTWSLHPSSLNFVTI